ncbi:MAG: PcfK-like family protein [Flavobacteriaceae bacterium]|jgi:hypothetical protein|nr:PcfK-like family protein [Flavobacteriaceae bacterium]
MEASNDFKEVIKNYLDNLAKQDTLFAETYMKENKNIDDCITYILNQVKSSGCNAFTDDEIFNMAVHYYDEDNIKVGKKINAKVIHSSQNITAPPKTIEKLKPKKAKPSVSNQMTMEL